MSDQIYEKPGDKPRGFNPLWLIIGLLLAWVFFMAESQESYEHYNTHYRNQR